ncbi:LacI family DNA-binding transcriptional regulator [Opitutus sp. ER46]|uniref:LacI family DNA-binding transcriptional regulator n=1 Tax=Opitutus sp. ER46 TaxID=2161864 RepID=UPI000D300602|nr:LacI family DNA-binding transcriptional regulator [Opitutus sp. ER46]PTX95658.1 LacI family transcriptional regulator [Opitutus sp. ER46]
MASDVPTLRSLARALGLSRTTVSDALRGSPRVDPNTASRVKKAAREAGYRRNPLAGALMSELRRSRGAAFRGVIAAIDFNEPNRPAAAAAYHKELVSGAEERASELGFKVERFVVGNGGVSVQRLDSILQSRGIHGVVLLPAWDEPDLTNLDWHTFAGIYTDYIIEHPALHSVCPDHYRSMLAALQRLAGLGYRQPGLLLQKHQDERLQFRWGAAFRAFLENHPEVRAVPPLIVENFTREEFVKWFRKHKPDVVISHHSEAMDWMESCGARIPETHGFVALNVWMKTRPCAGLDLQPRTLGARATELLIAQLQRNETGIPEWPLTTTIPARWVDGPSVRQLKP